MKVYNLASVIKSFRAKHKLSQQDFASLSDLHLVTIRGVEMGASMRESSKAKILGAIQKYDDGFMKTYESNEEKKKPEDTKQTILEFSGQPS